MHFVPKTINFSELEKLEKDGEVSQGIETQIGDDGLGIEKVEQDFHLEELIVQMLSALEGNERVIFLYQLLRDYGYQIDHTSFARTLGLKRSRYMDILSTVRTKTYLVIRGLGGSCSKQTNHV